MLELITKDTWILSDHHFGHKTIGQWEPDRIEATEKYGFESFEEMLIAKHNALVSPEDVCLFLGDFAFSSPAPWLDRLNGRKILILGNHDTRGDEAYKGFEYILRGLHIECDGMTFIHEHEDRLMSAIIKVIGESYCVFSHYPLWFDDEYNRQDGDKITKRMEVLERISDKFGVEHIFHGHLHSKTAKVRGRNHINVCCEHHDYEPKRIGDLL